LNACNNFDELAAQLVNGRFVGTTKLTEKGYVRLDGNEDIFPDIAEQEALEKQTEEEIDDLPDFDEDKPKAPFSTASTRGLGREVLGPLLRKDLTMDVIISNSKYMRSLHTVQSIVAS
jgi:hypothetical protein